MNPFIRTSARRVLANMPMVSRSARGHSSKTIFIVVVLLVTLLCPLLVFFAFPSPLSFQPSKLEAGSVGELQSGHPRRLGLPVPDWDCKCKLKACTRPEDTNAVVQSLETEERSKAFEKIFTTDLWGGGESRSGPGSRIDYTANARRLIAHALKEYHVGRLLDAPCGDVNWQPLIEGFNSTTYTGYDIVPQIIEQNTKRFREWPNVDFARVDFVNTPITINPDLIVCRDAIQHNTLKDGVRGFCNLEASGAKYLVTNWHTETGRGIVPDNAVNFDVPFGGAYPINVFTHPFNFSRPEFFISEGVNGINGDGKLVGVWKLPALWKGDGKRFQVPDALSERVRREIISIADVEAALRRQQ